MINKPHANDETQIEDNKPQATIIIVMSEEKDEAIEIMLYIT